MGNLSLKYDHPALRVDMAIWNTVFECDENGLHPVQLQVEPYRGALVYRKPGSHKLIGYRLLKKGWIKGHSYCAAL
jgi:hypothetical protein